MRAAGALLTACCCATALAAGLDISQFSYRAGELQVVVKTPSAPASAPPTAGDGAFVALGTQPLKVKSVQVMDPAGGAAVAVSMDISRSMESVGFGGISRVVMDTLQQLPPASRAGLLTIGAEVRTPVEFGPIPAVIDAMAKLTANAPETALNEGLLRAQDWAMEGSADLPLRRFVLLVTDGQDDSNKAIGTAEMLGRVQAGGVPIYGIAVLRTRANRQQLASLESLASVARASGGAFIATTLATLDADLQALIAEAQRAQLITASCDGCGADGSVRELQVRLTQGGNSVSGVRQVRLIQRPGEVVPTPPPAASVPPPPEKSLLQQVAEALKTTEDVVKALVGIATTLITFWLFVNRKLIAQRARQVGHTVAIWIGLEPRKTVDPKIERDDSTNRLDNDEGKPVKLTVDVDGFGRQEISVGTTDVVLGRSAKADIAAPDDEEASARHAALYVDKGTLMLRDLGSVNGTALNGTPIKRAEPVHDHDVVRFGRTHVRIYFGQL